jgi:5-methylcytosine-specific restriction protein B
MKDVITKILDKYPSARTSTPFAGKHEIYSLFEKLKEEVSEFNFVSSNQNLLVKVSYGKGKWAAIPWLAILDKRETTTTQRGTYVVILFESNGKGFDLKLAQGVTEIIKIHGSSLNAIDELRKRANKIKTMFPSMANTEFAEGSKDPTPQKKIGKTVSLHELYEASTIYSKHYKCEAIPSNDELYQDISTLVDCYEGMFFK